MVTPVAFMRGSVPPGAGNVKVRRDRQAASPASEGVYRVCTGTASHPSPSQARQAKREARPFAHGMVSDGQVHGSASFAKNKVRFDPGHPLS